MAMTTPTSGGTVRCTRCGALQSDRAEWCTCGAYLPYGREAVASAPRTGVNITLDKTNLAVAPGQEISCEIRLRNLGQLVDRFVLSVSDSVDAWTVLEPTTVSLFPASAGSAVLRLRPPRGSVPSAGTVTFTVIATSEADPTVRAMQEASVEVARYDEVRAQMVPPTVQGREAGRFRLVIANAGNAAVTAMVEGRTRQESGAVMATPPVVSLAPGARAEAIVEIRPHRLLADGAADVFHVLDVSVTAEQSQPITLEATMVQQAAPPPPPPTPVGGQPPVGGQLPFPPGYGPEGDPMLAGAGAPAAAPARPSPFTVRWAPLIGAVGLLVSLLFPWLRGSDASFRAFSIPFESLVKSEGTLNDLTGTGVTIGLILLFAGLVALVLSFLKDVAVWHRMVGAVALAVVGGVVAQTVRPLLNEGFRADDILSAFGPGPWIAAVATIILIVGK
jgi:hypothetical protein